jgi:hypothetical protein
LGREVIEKGKKSEKLYDFMMLVSNVMEAYTTALFTVEDEGQKSLKLYSCCSFSKNIDEQCLLFPGEGFVSWVQREQKPVLVNHFERSTTTLKFYQKDESIKSLLAVPLPAEQGVLYVDSKKSYRFTEEREKICRQMAATALILIQAEKEAEERLVLANMLSLSGEMDLLLASGQSRENLLRKGLEIVGRRLGLDYTFFVVPDEIVHYCQPGTRINHFIHRASPAGSFSRGGLLGWAIKNRKKIVREKIDSTPKSYVLHKEESLGPFTNFVGVPLFEGGSNRDGGAGLIKPGNQRWHALEVETVWLVLQRFFRKWVGQQE